MVVAEFLGTGLLALVILSVQRSNIGIPYFVGIAAGIAVAAFSYAFGGVSGAHFNPALTLGLWTARKVKTVPALTYVVAQLLGGWAAYAVYTYFINQPLQKLGGTFTMRVFAAEAIGAFIFGLVWAAVAARRLNVSVAGLGLALGVMVSASAAIGLINPAVAISARAWEFVNTTGLLTYALAPVVGAVLGVNLYYLLFAEQETKVAAAPVKVAEEKVVVTEKAAVKKPAARATTARAKSTAKKSSARKRSSK